MHATRSPFIHRSLRATVRTALAALVATGASACVFIDDLTVEVGDPSLPDPEVPDRPHDHVPDRPCDKDPGPDMGGSTCGDDGGTGGSGGEGTPTGGDEPPVDSVGGSGETGDGETGAMDTGADETGETGAEATGDPTGPICGDGVIAGDEACDDGVNDGSYGGCLAGCAGLAPFCGDGEVNDPSEMCDDGDMLDDATCTSLCQLPICGDGILQGAEECDGAAALASSCVMEDEVSIGVLACDAETCSFAMDSCSLCGNAAIDDGEACDGAELAGASCESLGFAGGALACDAQCGALDTSGCVEGVDPVSCCVVGEPAACEIQQVTDCVCEQAPACCKLAWDETCVDIAIKACFAQCP